MIAQLFVEFHATFEVFHHRQCVVILGFQFGDALVQGVLVESNPFSCKRIKVCAMALRLCFVDPTLIADALALRSVFA